MLKAAGGEAADRLQLIRGLERIRDVADGQAGGGEPRRIGDDLDLPRVRRQHFDIADAGDARQRRPHHIEGIVVQFRRRQAARQVDAQERKGGRREALEHEVEIRRQLAADLGDMTLRLLQRHDHVGGRLELRGDLGRAAERRRADAPDARHFHQRLFERARHRQHHRPRRQRAAVADGDDARKDQRRIDVARQGEAGDQARGRKHRRDGEDGAPMALDESGERHVEMTMSAPSGRPC